MLFWSFVVFVFCCFVVCVFCCYVVLVCFVVMLYCCFGLLVFWSFGVLLFWCPWMPGATLPLSNPTSVSTAARLGFGAGGEFSVVVG